MKNDHNSLKSQNWKFRT